MPKHHVFSASAPYMTIMIIQNFGHSLIHQRVHEQSQTANFANCAPNMILLPKNVHLYFTGETEYALR
jgi:hypothetical protein